MAATSQPSERNSSAAALAAAALFVLAVSSRLLPVRTGLRGSYFTNIDVTRLLNNAQREAISYKNTAVSYWINAAQAEEQYRKESQLTENIGHISHFFAS